MNIPVTKTIAELKDHRFFVPSYQRGYRWTEYEVTALLDDISEFLAEGGKRYCIQPLIVKYRDNGAFEVVDGQQRLTTIYIFMKIASQEIRSAKPPFELEYATRDDSASFLKSLSDDVDFEDVRKNNIDYYHIADAYEKINSWLDRQPDKSVAIQELNTKIRKSVFFIWYEMPLDSDPIAMFTKVNLGKIPLTNAELIKALLLNKDNFGADPDNRQIEMSLAWDRIEQGLHASLDELNLDDTLLPSKDNVEGEILRNEEMAELIGALEILTPEQLGLVKKVYFEGRTMASIAIEEGVSKAAITYRMKVINEKIKKILI